MTATDRRTTPPGHHVLLYDGKCRFCTAGAQRFLRFMGRIPVELLDFQQPGALTRFPDVTFDECMKAMVLVTPDGKVHTGAEAAAQGLATRPFLRWLPVLYHLPVFRQLLDGIYALLAANRYRLMGKVGREETCEGGTCDLHFPPSASR